MLIHRPHRAAALSLFEDDSSSVTLSSFQIYRTLIWPESVCVQNGYHNHQLSFLPSSFSVLQGYLFISVLVNSNSELIRLINNAIKNDLSSRNPTFMCLALHCIANVGSREMAEAFAGEIPRILVAG